jgi:D-glycero-D-manno-heptose 1,7-bisphosphate phosphatase
MLKQALILAGGLGTRLGVLTQAMPKPMLPVAGRPFLEHVIFNLRRHGLDKIVLSVGHLADRVMDHFGDGGSLGVSITYSREISPLGTGGGLRHALPMLGDSFLVLNGDTLFDCNYLDMARLLGNDVLAVLGLRHVEDASRYGSVHLEGGRVLGFHEKSRTGAGLVSGGVYAFTRQAAELLPLGASSIETGLFPLLAQRGFLAAKAYRAYFIDIGLPSTLSQADTAIPKWQRKPGIFIDLASLLSPSCAFGFVPGGAVWTDDAVSAVKWCNDGGYLVFGLAEKADRWPAPERESFLEEPRRMGAHLDALYPCDATAFLDWSDQARKDWDLDLARSLLLSGRWSDGAVGEIPRRAVHVTSSSSLSEYVKKVVPPL